jgi:CBS-domain-containing membrane protein
MRSRYDLKTEAKLALMPTITIGVILLLMSRYANGQLFFTSLASSAFLVYLDPKHPFNSLATLFIAQIAAALIGIGGMQLIGPGYAAALLAMAGIIIFMLVFDVMHPPAVSTALSFAFISGRVLPLFFICLCLLTFLIILQKLTVAFIHFKRKKNH